jgi:hypothetical protein
MSRYLWIAVLTFCGSGFSQQPKPIAVKPEDAALAAQRQFLTPMGNKDVAALNRIVAEGFVGDGAGGHIAGKSAILDFHQGPTSFASVKMEDPIVKIFDGSTAVLWAAGVQASDTQRNTCDAMVGVWEYLQPSAPGLAVIAKMGTKYVGVFFNSLRAPDVPSTEPSTDAEKAVIYSKSAAGAWEQTCEGSAGKARLKLRWLYSLRPPPVGSEATLDWEQDGNEAKWWWLGTDGKRGAMGAGRLLK